MMNESIENSSRLMKVVYTLQEELSRNPEYIAQVQALTLDLERPRHGLKGTHGLYGSDEWWESIRVRRIASTVVSGIINELFFAGQDSRWGDQVNSFELKLQDGSTIEESIYAHRKPDRKLFVVGATVRIVYVLDEMKEQPARDGGINYSQSVLEMAVSGP